jgi:hypothetical protein
MSLLENREIKKTIKNLKEEMIEYIEPGETEYSETDVASCVSLVNNFLVKIWDTDSKQSGMLAVKEVVLALNDLNEKCHHELIETEQREQLADIIILSGYLKNYNTRNEDITEDWREW